MTTTTENTPPGDRDKIQRITLGTVVSDKRDKTCTVAVQYQLRHAKYGKYLQRQAKFHVHDPKNQAKVGDRVQITPCRPISKTKAWRLVNVVASA